LTCCQMPRKPEAQSVPFRGQREVEGLGLTAADHALANRATLGDLGQRFACITTLNSLRSLEIRQIALATGLAASSQCTLATVASPLANQPNSAVAASKVESSRPCAEPVSQSGSPSERDNAPALPIRSIRSSSSVVQRPSRSSLVTTTSPAFKPSHQLRELRPVSPGARHLLTIDGRCAGSLECLKLA
jgi:hypothetical protein